MVNDDDTPLRVALTGSSGLLGQELSALLAQSGFEVVPVVRHAPHAGQIRWDPERGSIDAAALEGLAGVVHLAGETIQGRWTKSKRARIRQSRVAGTRLLARTLAGLEQPPAVVVSASAVGWYGDRGGDELAEDEPAGTGFLAEVVREWEAALEPAEQAGLRVVRLRFGTIQSPKGGALARMLLPFRLGLGGPVGGGDQWWPWISLHDAARVVRHAIVTPAMRGVYNAAGPEQVTARQYACTLGRTLHRPAVVPVPGWSLRLVFGRLVDDALLASQRVNVDRLRATGYEFEHPTLEAALRYELGRSDA